VPGAVVVGTGFGCRIHVPALRSAGFDVVALVGRDRDRTLRRAGRCGVPHACTSLGDAFSLGGVDAVTIATPPDSHAALAIEACEHRRHVLCEKPFALTSGEAAAMFAAADGAGVTHLVGHEFRWSPERAVAARAIHDGLIGEPRMFSAVQYVPLVAGPDARVPKWWFDASRGGGWLGASGSHLVDQLRTWLGEIASVSAALPVVSARRDVAEDSYVVRLTMRSGVQGVMQQTAASWTQGVVGTTAVGGTRGTLEVTHQGVWISDAAGRRLLAVPDDLVLPSPPAASADPRERYTHIELGPYTRLCEVLADGVDGRAALTPVAPPTFADGLAGMRVLDAIRASATAGGRVELIDDEGG
jgi:predicted dehydrogenase